FDLIGFKKRAASLPELQLRALREFVERLRQRRTGSKRPVRQAATSMEATRSRASTPSVTAPARGVGEPTTGPELPESPARQAMLPSAAPERAIAHALGGPNTVNNLELRCPRPQSVG